MSIVDALVLALAAILLGCGDDDHPAIDASTPDADPNAVVPPTPPASAELPHLTPCPDGWEERATPEGVPSCEPFPAGIPRCEGATTLRPGERACTPIGSPCSADEWSTMLPDDAPIAFVRSGATGGNGTRARPFGTLAEAVNAIADGGTIALGAGRFDGVQLDRRSIAIVGKCAPETSIGLTAGLDPAHTIAMNGGRLTLRDLHLFEGLVTLYVDEGDLEIGGVWFGPGRVAIFADQTTLRARDSVFREHYLNGAAISVTNGALDIEDVGVEHADRGIQLGNGEARLHRVSFIEHDARSRGQALTFFGLGEGAVDQIAIEGWYDGIIAGFAPQTVRDVVVRHLASFPAIENRSDANTTVERALIEDVPGSAVFANGELTLRDVAIRETDMPTGTDEDGSSGLTISEGGVVVVERVSFDHMREVGIDVETRSTLRGSDVTIRDVTRVESGFGLVTGVGVIDVTRIHLERCAGAGIVLASAARARIGDLSVESVGDTLSLTSAGIALLGGAELILDRASIREVHMVGVLATDTGTHLDAHDVAVREVRPLASGHYGRGIETSLGASAEIERLAIADLHDHGILAFGDATMTLADVSVDGVRSRACVEEECTRHPAGIGVAAYDAALALERFAIRDAMLCGAHRGANAAMTLRSGLVASSAVGLCVGGDARAEDISFDVAYRDNGENLNARELPVPMATPPIEVMGE